MRTEHNASALYGTALWLRNDAEFQSVTSQDPTPNYSRDGLRIRRLAATVIRGLPA